MGKPVKIVPHQIGEPTLRDKLIPALPPGKRISASGKVYYEYRANRSDLPGDYPGQYPPSWLKMLKNTTTQILTPYSPQRRENALNPYIHNSSGGGGMKVVNEIPITTAKGSNVVVRIIRNGDNYLWEAEVPRFGKVKSSDFRLHYDKRKGVQYIEGISQLDGKPVFITLSDSTKIERYFHQIREWKEQRRKEKEFELIKSWLGRKIENIGGDPWEGRAGYINAPEVVINYINKMIAEKTGVSEWEASDEWLTKNTYVTLVKSEYEGLTPTQIIERVSAKILERKRKEKEKERAYLEQARRTGKPVMVKIWGYDGDDWQSVKMYGTPEIIRAKKRGEELGWVVVYRVYYPDGRVEDKHVPSY